MKPLSICFLTGTLGAVGGAERMTATVANAMARRGHRIHVLSLWDPTSCFPLAPEVRHDALFTQRPSFKRHYLTTVARLRRYLHAHRIDVLVEVDTMLSLFTLPATIGLPVRRVAWEHCHFDQDLGKPARRLARRLAARFGSYIVVLTERDRARWQEALGPLQRIRVIPNPLPFDPPAHPAARVQPRVLAVGRLVEAKGFDVLLHAWSRVTAAFPQWRLQIIGEGEARGSLEALCRTLQLEQSVELPGMRSDVEAFYREASIFCLSSRYEGFGLVLIEAMAWGLPVVSTDCETGPKSLLRAGENALTVPVDDARALADALGRLMADGALCDSLASAGRAAAAAYAPEPVLRQWDVLLQEVGAGLRAGRRG